MKNLKSIYLLLAAVMVLTACTKSFLDEKPPTSDPVADAIKTESDLSDAVNGMYNSMRSINSFGTYIPILEDELADNTYVSAVNSGYFLPEQNYLLLSTNGEASGIYSQCYYTILQANRIIYAAQSLAQSNNVLQLEGEAYAVRATNYLALVNLFARPYAVNPAGLGVPIVTAPTNIAGPFIKPARATVGAVYTKIISDLDSAFAIMPTTGTTLHATNSDYFSKYAAKAIESRAYLYKGDYASARDAALSVVNNGGYTLTTNLNAYWNNPAPVATKVETIFELELNLANNNGFSSLDNYYNQPLGYGQELIYDAVYALYSATDTRRALLLTSSPKRGTVTVLNKYQNTANTADKDNVKIIRYAEVLLTLAESYSRTGDDVNAQKYLNQLVSNRDPSAVPYVSTGAQLQSDILNERRKELVGEGLRLNDLNRLQLDINRPNQSGIIGTLQVIPFADYRRVLPIPQAETDANPATVQNPGGY